MAVKKYFHAILFLIPICVFSQIFERIETISGLDILEENNGVAVADFDNDNDLDLFVVAKERENQNEARTISRLFRNNNDGSFTDVTENSGLLNIISGPSIEGEFLGLDGAKFGVSWGDFNNDGFPDLFFTHVSNVQLFQNMGDGTFNDVTRFAGIDYSEECRATGATWFDCDNDGYLDIFISDWEGCDENSLFKNNGDGTFQKIQFTQDEVVAPSYTMLPFDFNSDGWMDMYVTNDKNFSNNLYINQAGNGFVDYAQSYGAANAFDDMGIAIGDIENDGDFDIFLTGISENALLVNSGSNNYSEESLNFNLGGTSWSWGCKFADFDLDFDEDLLIVNGFRAIVESNVYYENLLDEGKNEFKDSSVDVGLTEFTQSPENLPFDYDNDGDLDLFISNSDRESYFYENKTINNPSSNFTWFKLELEGTISNRDAIGTKVEIKTPSGKLVRYHSGVGFISQSLQPVHFGLNGDNEVLELTIYWPSGLIDSYTNLAVNSTFKATEGVGIQNLYIQPSVKD